MVNIDISLVLWKQYVNLSMQSIISIDEISSYRIERLKQQIYKAFPQTKLISKRFVRTTLQSAKAG